MYMYETKLKGVRGQLSRGYGSLKIDTATQLFLVLNDMRHEVFLEFDTATHGFLKIDRVTHGFLKIDRVTLTFLIIDMRHGDHYPPSTPLLA